MHIRGLSSFLWNASLTSTTICFCFLAKVKAEEEEGEEEEEEVEEEEKEEEDMGFQLLHLSPTTRGRPTLCILCAAVGEGRCQRDSPVDHVFS